MYFGVIEGERGRFEAAVPYLAKAADTFDAFGVVERTVASLHALLDAQMELLQWSRRARHQRPPMRRCANASAIRPWRCS